MIKPKLNYFILAFTLSEVLITLGIIGIVAVLTMPSLINKYQKVVLFKQLKNSYSILSQAYSKALFDFGAPSDCYYGGRDTTCNAIFNYFIENLNVVKTCKSSYKEGCTPKYISIQELDEFKTVKGAPPVFGYPGLVNDCYAYVLANGTILLTAYKNSPRPMAIDINGKKGPNEWGYDLFGIEPNNKNPRKGSSLVLSEWARQNGGFTLEETNVLNW